MTDYKEFTKQMRENAVKNEQGNIVCSLELWEEIASVIERAIIPPCKVGDKVYTIFEGDIEIITIIRSYREETINGFSTAYDARNNFLSRCFSEVSIGKTVFLTKEEAEEKLKELGK